ncbi:hypothetical protein WA556_000553 [Blastocystis sp. ATCC 50177/Nand II]
MNIRQDDPLDELCICLHCQYASPRSMILYHQCQSTHPFIILSNHLAVKCLYCDDIIYSDHLSFYLSFIQDSLYAGQDPIQLYKLSDLRFDLHDALTEHCANYCKIQDSSLIGIKGLLNLGGTDAFNCILQCFLHLPFLVDFFLSGNHSSISCFLHSAVDESNQLRCLLCCFRELLFSLFHDDNNSFCVPSALLYCFWTRFPAMQCVSSMDVRDVLSYVLEGLTVAESPEPFIASLFAEEVELPREECPQCRTMLERRSANRGVDVQKVECMEEVLSVAYGERVRRKCDVCGKEMEVAELLEVVKAPRVVVMVTERSEKPQRRSVFYRIRGERKEVYDLYGVVCQPRRGIEKAFCVLRVNRSWYKFQDEKVFLVTECYLDLVEPSILLYVKRYCGG